MALLKDPTKWEAFRKDKPSIQPDLSQEDFSEQTFQGDFSGVRFDNCRLKDTWFLTANLYRASFVDADLRLSKLQGAKAHNISDFNRREATFRRAHMTDSVMGYADFTGADFAGADLRGAQFDGAVLTGANFSSANLAGARFPGAYLGKTVFSGANLRGTDFDGAIAEWTVFDNVDLTGARNLHGIDHRGPSSLSVSTIYRSHGKIPESFLFSAQRDIPEEFLRDLNDVVRKTPFEYRSCFLSYSHGDDTFVDALHTHLKSHGVQCWKDKLNLLPGQNFEDKIIEAIHRYDRFVVVLSARSVRSDWVKKEISIALDRKPYDVLPIRLDKSVAEVVEEWALQLRGSRHIADFSGWNDPELFRHQCDLMLRQLRYE